MIGVKEDEGRGRRPGGRRQEAEGRRQKAGGWNTACSLLRRDPRSLVQTRRHLLPQRRNVSRLERRWGWRFRGADRPPGLPRGPWRHLHLAHAVLSVTEP